MRIKGNIVDVFRKVIYPGCLTVEDGKITRIDHDLNIESKDFLLPGFIDAHVHIESSMLVPSEFARLAVIHGTVGTVSDPHEIANVLGVAGVDYMIENGKTVPFHFNFGAPSCVPATRFESAGADIDSSQIETLLRRSDIRYLSEMMNYPGVLFQDEEVMKKISAAKKAGKPIDGHSPGLTGDKAEQYIHAGTDDVVISTDHECFTYEEGLFKLQHGMKVLIREGSAARNFEALIPLLDQYPDRVMFCSDDKHPDDLVKGHINQLVARALAKGCDFWNVIRAATLNPVVHYTLECGLLREGDSADFIVVDDLQSFSIKKTFVKGQLVAESGKSNIGRQPISIVNNFHCTFKQPHDFRVPAEGVHIRVIEARDGQLITGEKSVALKSESGAVVTDVENDILKFTVVNRYQDVKPAVGFITHFGLKEGAIASCVGHDSHNILAVGVDDEMICRAVNLVIESKGGLAAVTSARALCLPLPVAGIMSDDDAYHVAEEYGQIDAMAKEMGSALRAPFMTLSFMALLVIPQLKLSDRGLFDGAKFEFVSLFV
jgi:adenine deaminase